MGYVVVAEFRLKPECVEDFLTRMARHAALSRSEPGCRLFEVAQDTADPTTILLYERYDDEAAYLAHRATPHYALFREWAPPLLVPAPEGQIFHRRSVMMGRHCSTDS